MNIMQKIKKKFEKEYQVLNENLWFNKLLTFIYRYLGDKKKLVHEKSFNEYGLTVYSGRQGSGKTISLVERLEQIRRDFPDVMIATNFGYIYEDVALTDWQQLDDLRSDQGIVFAIDEIQNEFDVYETRNFNLDLLKVITQQRKQGIKILATSQIFTRVSKPLREQTFEVVQCHTFAGRWTFQKCFDADDYNAFIDSNSLDNKFKVPRKWRKNFIQNDHIRNLFDSYAVIESMKKLIAQNK